MAWTFEATTVNAAWRDYGAPADTNFVSRGSATGHGNVVLAGLNGLATPIQGEVMRLTWNKGLSDEQIHFEGVIHDVERQDKSPLHHIRFLDVASYYGQTSRTGATRYYKGQTPFSIMFLHGTPPDLLDNAAGTQTMLLGNLASVPNKVTVGTPGTALDDFVADSERLVVNWQRLCVQARYGDGSYGLEYFGKLEGAFGSSPRLYLVKRREQSPAPAETLTVGDEVFKAVRGAKGDALDAVRVVGGGHGQTRIESTLVGTGPLEGVIQDKSIVNSVNAQNMATRIQQLMDPGNTSVTAWTYKHNLASRVGDTVTLVQSGFSNVVARIFEIGYEMRSKTWTIHIGRPRRIGTDAFASIEQSQGGHGTVGQKRGSASNGFAINNESGTFDNGDTLPLAVSLTTAYQPVLHDGITVAVNFETDGLGDYDLEVELDDGVTTQDYVLERIEPQSTILGGGGEYVYQHVFLLTSAQIEAFGSLGDVLVVNVRFTNRTGVNNLTVAGIAKVGLVGA